MIPNPFIILAVVAAFMAATGGAYWKGRNDGVALEKARVEHEILENTKAARRIENNAAACERDPACILPDPWRR